jgi:serine/threonine protein phosphatase PrpC
LVATKNENKKHRLVGHITMLAHSTKQGSKGFNEDAAGTQTIRAPEHAHLSAPSFVHVLTVADGHGLRGEGLDCSTHCVDFAMNWVKTLFYQDWETVDWEKCSADMTQLMHDTYRDKCVAKYPRRSIVNGVVYDPLEDDGAVHSGSTFSHVLVFPWKDGFRTVAIQVGDSDIYVNGHQVECDHSPLNPSEFQRLQSFPESERHRLVFNKPDYPEVFLPTGEYDPAFYDKNAKSKPYLWKWTTGLVPSCAKYTPGVYTRSPPTAEYNTCMGMTRAIGDFYANAGGVITTPQVSIMDTAVLPEVCIGSDGAWDTIDNSERWIGKGINMGVNDFIHIIDDLETVLMVRVDALRALAIEKFGKNVDDISLAVLRPS